MSQATRLERTWFGILIPVFTGLVISILFFTHRDEQEEMLLRASWWLNPAFYGEKSDSALTYFLHRASRDPILDEVDPSLTIWDAWAFWASSDNFLTPDQRGRAFQMLYYLAAQGHPSPAEGVIPANPVPLGEILRSCTYGRPPCGRYWLSLVREGGLLDLRGLVLPGAVLANASLPGADLSGATLTGAWLPRAGLQGSKLDEADLGGADLQGACLLATSLVRTGLAGAGLSSALLAGSRLEDDDWEGASFAGAMLAGAFLKHKGPWNAIFDNAVFGGGAVPLWTSSQERFIPDWEWSPCDSAQMEGCRAFSFPPAILVGGKQGDLANTRFTGAVLGEGENRVLADLRLATALSGVPNRQGDPCPTVPRGLEHRWNSWRGHYPDNEAAKKHFMRQVACIDDSLPPEEWDYDKLIEPEMFDLLLRIESKQANRANGTVFRHGEGNDLDGFELHFWRKESPYLDLGFRPHDVIHSVNGLPLTVGSELAAAVRATREAARLDFEITRDGQRMNLGVKVR